MTIDIPLLQEKHRWHRLRLKHEGSEPRPTADVLRELERRVDLTRPFMVEVDHAMQVIRVTQEAL